MSANKDSLNIQVDNTIFDNVEQLYDSYAKEFFNHFNNKQTADFDLIKKWINIYECKSPILELGCGYGEYSKLFSSIGKTASVDISNEMLLIAKRQNSNKNIAYIKDDMVDFLQNSTNNYKTIVIIYSLFHLPISVIYSFFETLKKHLKKNGYLILAVQEGFGTYINKKGIPYTLLSYSDLAQTLNKAGFKIIDKNLRAPIKAEAPFFKRFLIAKLDRA